MRSQHLVAAGSIPALFLATGAYAQTYVDGTNTTNGNTTGNTGTGTSGNTGTTGTDSGTMNTNATTQTTESTTTPGVPSTGVGGDMTANMIFLAVVLLVAIIGAIYVYRTARSANR